MATDEHLQPPKPKRKRRWLKRMAISGAACGHGLFTRCAAGDTALATVIKVG